MDQNVVWWDIVIGFVGGWCTVGRLARDATEILKFFVPHVDVVVGSWIVASIMVLVMLGPPQARDAGKERAIEQAIATNDTWQLRELALLDGGFLNGKHSCLLWRGQ
jgi:hypothetical protein